MRSHVRWLLLVGAPVVGGCQPPTQVTVTLTTDLACSELTNVTFSVASPELIESSIPRAKADQCIDGRIGSIVVVPGAAGLERFAVRAAAGVGVDAELACTKENDYGVNLPEGGCIVARRVLSFIEQTPLELPIALRASCIGVPCDEKTTCVAGVCVSADIDDPKDCDEAGGCDFETLPLPAPTGPNEEGGLLACQSEALTHDFSSDPTVDLNWKYKDVSGARVAIVDEEVRVTLQVPSYADWPASNYLFGALETSVDPRDYPFADCAVSVRVKEVPPADGCGYASFAVRTGANRFVEIYALNGKVWLRAYPGALETSKVPYDPVAQAYWRLRESGGKTYWETSPDGTKWTTHGSLDNPFDPSLVTVGLGGGLVACYAEENPLQDGIVRFDDLNLIGPD